MTFAYTSTLYFNHMQSTESLLPPLLQLVARVRVRVTVHVCTCVCVCMCVSQCVSLGFVAGAWTTYH